MSIEKVFLGHTNTIDLILKSNNTAVDLSGVAKMSLTFNGVTISATASTDATSIIKWNQTGYATGEVRLNLGAQATLSTGLYDVPLVVYESTSDTDGVMWGDIHILVKEEVESS